MEKGWVKTYRQMLENSFLMRDNNAFIVFNKLLLIVGQQKGEWSGGRRQLSEIVNINDNTLKDVLKRLENNGMISIESNSRYSIISIKNWHIYQNKPNGGEKRKTPRKTPLGIQRSFDDMTPTNPPRRHPDDTQTTPLYKEIEEEKEVNTNVLAKADNRKPEINNLFDFWHETIGYKIESKIQYNRRACSNLLKKHGENGVKKLIAGVFASKQDPFAPRIADFVQLQSKYNELISWGHSQNNKKPKIGIVR